MTHIKQQSIRTVSVPWRKAMFIGALTLTIAALLTLGLVGGGPWRVAWTMLAIVAALVAAIAGGLLLSHRAAAARGLAAPGEAERARMRAGMIGCLIVAFVVAVMPMGLVPHWLVRYITPWSNLILLLLVLGLASWFGWRLLRGAPPLDIRRAQRALREGRTQEALALCHSAAHEQPDHWAVLQTMAIVHRELGQHHQSLTCALKLVDRWPMLYHGHAELGMTHLAMGNPTDACAPLERAAELAPGLAVAHYNLGMARAEAQYHAKAIEPLAKALRLGLRDDIAEILARHQLMIAFDAVDNVVQAESERKRLRRRSRMLKRLWRELEFAPEAAQKRDLAIVADIERAIQAPGSSRRQ